MGGGVSSLSACECSPSKRSAVAGSLAAWAAERARWHAPAWCSWLPLASMVPNHITYSAGRVEERKNMSVSLRFLGSCCQG